MIIRKAELKDLKDLLELFKQVEDYHRENTLNMFKETSKEYRTNYIMEWIDAENRYFYVAERNNKVIGLINAEISVIENNPEIQDKRYIKIHSIVVDKENRRNGIATLLLEHIEKISKELSLDFIELNVWDFNPAIKVYEKSGYEPTLHRMRKELK